MSEHIQHNYDLIAVVDRRQQPEVISACVEAGDNDHYFVALSKWNTIGVGKIDPNI